MNLSFQVSLVRMTSVEDLVFMLVEEKILIKQETKRSLKKKPTHDSSICLSIFFFVSLLTTKRYFLDSSKYFAKVKVTLFIPLVI